MRLIRAAVVAAAARRWHGPNSARLLAVLCFAACGGTTSALETMCRQGPALPAPSKMWLQDASQRTASGAGFAIDAENALLFVDEAGDLVKRSSTGRTKIWVKNAAANAAALAVLPTGEVVVSDPGIASLVKFHPTGARTVILAALDMPGSVEVDLNGDVYVAERLSNTIRRVNPQSKVAEVVARNMTTVPGSLAFSPDYQTLYVGGANDGTVWALHKDDHGSFDAPEKFAEVPASKDPCERLNAGQSCGFLTSISGVCTPTEAGSLYCQQTGGCKTKGDACEDELGQPGLCATSEEETLFCAPELACSHHQAGDSCVPASLNETALANVGVCTLSDKDLLYCRPAPSCEGKTRSDACFLDGGQMGVCVDAGSELRCTFEGPCVLKDVGERCQTDEGQVGVCLEDNGSYVACKSIETCAGKTEGMACATELNDDGLCQAVAGDVLLCRVPVPCEGNAIGDNCESRDGWPGRCVGYRDAEPAPESGSVTAAGLYCAEINDCEGQRSDNPCVTKRGSTGRCAAQDAGGFRCEEATPCTDLKPGDACALASGEAGMCVHPFPKELSCEVVQGCDLKSEGDLCDETGTCTNGRGPNRYCQQSTSCESTALGDPCEDADFELNGTCTARSDGEAYCRTDNPCEMAALGDPCQTEGKATLGTCQSGLPGRLYCYQPPPCEGKAAGDLCRSGADANGVCVDVEDGLLDCEVDYFGVCRDFGEGYACVNENGQRGMCVANGNSVAVCGNAPPCFEQAQDSQCEGAFGVEGLCTPDVHGSMACEHPLPCEGKDDGDTCLDTVTGASGRCRAGAFGAAVCLTPMPCDNKRVGDTCSVGEFSAGTCVRANENALLWCHLGFSSGAIGGIDTDACGSVYVTDVASEVVWQFTGNGEPPKAATTIGRQGVTQLSWGTGIGEWKADTLYLGVDGAKEVVATKMGVRGRPRTKPSTTVPPEPKADTAFDCLHIPQGPLGVDAVRELGRARGFHDLAFDSEGYVIGHDGFNLVRVNAAGESDIYTTGFSAVGGMDWLPDGSLVASTEKGLARIYPDGAQVLIATDIAAYGVTVGPDGLVYTDSNDRVMRVNPDSGEQEVFLDAKDFGSQVSLRSVEFDPDATVMYVTTVRSPQIFAVPLDEDLNISGALQPFAVIPGASLQDGLGVDVCGNLYVPVFEHSALYRITPDGAVSRLLQMDAIKYGHGVEWGSGFGGFDANKLYLPQPYDNNTVVEVNIGVPSRRPSVQPSPH